MFFVFFFFFQAEDGIRDLTVTGVQTCALPIFTSKRNVFNSFVAGIQNVDGMLADVALIRAGSYIGADFEIMSSEAIQRRSEERRVGKECRSRWSPYH